MIKLILSIGIFLISLLNIVHAPSYLFWKLSVGVSEFPYLFLMLTLLFLLLIPGRKFRLPSNLLLGLAGILFSSPLVRAVNTGMELPQALDKAFGKEKTPVSPLSLTKLFRIHFANGNTFRTMAYYTRSGKELSLDFYPVIEPGLHPCVVVIHGGAWSVGDSHQLPELNEELCDRGFQVAAINYRLAPKSIFPAPAEDVKSALDFLKAQSPQLFIDTTAFILLGRSAGGQIALTSAYTLGDPDIRGVVAFYAPADMVWGYSIPCNPLIMDSKKVMEDYLGGTYLQVGDNFRKSSPLEWAGPHSPPTLLIHGSQDVMVAWEHSRRLDEKLGKLGVPHFLLTLPWATHGCDFNINGPSGQLSSYSIFRFLNSLFNPKKRGPDIHLWKN